MGGVCARAQVEIVRASERGRTVPARVFSRQMRRVGQAWMSELVMVCFLMSERLRWCVLEGVMGMASAPEREARPPASLVVRLYQRLGSNCFRLFMCRHPASHMEDIT